MSTSPAASYSRFCMKRIVHMCVCVCVYKDDGDMCSSGRLRNEQGVPKLTCVRLCVRAGTNQMGVGGGSSFQTSYYALSRALTLNQEPTRGAILNQLFRAATAQRYRPEIQMDGSQRQMNSPTTSRARVKF